MPPLLPALENFSHSWRLGIEFNNQKNKIKQNLFI
jgi:hypothetical protein